MAQNLHHFPPLSICYLLYGIGNTQVISICYQPQVSPIFYYMLGANLGLLLYGEFPWWKWKVMSKITKLTESILNCDILIPNGSIKQTGVRAELILGKTKLMIKF